MLPNVGLPHPSTFPFYSLSAEVKSMGSTDASPVVNGTVSDEKAQSTQGRETVLVPHAHQPGKAENLSASLQVRGPENKPIHW